MTKKPCDHANLVKIEEDKEQGHSLFKCLACGRLIAKDKNICTLCGGLPVDDITDHMLHLKLTHNS
jgi:rRNA maturation endonuclease Nob1